MRGSRGTGSLATCRHPSEGGAAVANLRCMLSWAILVTRAHMGTLLFINYVAFIENYVRVWILDVECDFWVSNNHSYFLKPNWIHGLKALGGREWTDNGYKYDILFLLFTKICVLNILGIVRSREDNKIKY